MDKINEKTLKAILENINGQTKEQYVLYQSNGGYSLYTRLESGGMSASNFGTDLCLTGREMYYYLRGLQKAIGAIRWNGTRGLLKPKC
jgi:hypothetical protein